MSSLIIFYTQCFHMASISRSKHSINICCKHSKGCQGRFHPQLSSPCGSHSSQRTTWAMHNIFLYDVTSVHVGSGFYFTLFGISACNSDSNFCMLLNKYYESVCSCCLSSRKSPTEVVPTQKQVNWASGKMLLLVLKRIVKWWSEILN